VSNIERRHIGDPSILEAKEVAQFTNTAQLLIAEAFGSPLEDVNPRELFNAIISRTALNNSFLNRYPHVEQRTHDEVATEFVIPNPNAVLAPDQPIGYYLKLPSQKLNGRAERRPGEIAHLEILGVRADGTQEHYTLYPDTEPICPDEAPLDRLMSVHAPNILDAIALAGEPEPKTTTPSDICSKIINLNLRLSPVQTEGTSRVSSTLDFEPTLEGHKVILHHKAHRAGDDDRRTIVLEFGAAPDDLIHHLDTLGTSTTPGRFRAMTISVQKPDGEISEPPLSTAIYEEPSDASTAPEELRALLLDNNEEPIMREGLINPNKTDELQEFINLYWLVHNRIIQSGKRSSRAKSTGANRRPENSPKEAAYPIIGDTDSSKGLLRGVAARVAEVAERLLGNHF
jgi:hypothetical protein